MEDVSVNASDHHCQAVAPERFLQEGGQLRLPIRNVGLLLVKMGGLQGFDHLPQHK